MRVNSTKSVTTKLIGIFLLFVLIYFFVHYSQLSSTFQSESEADKRSEMANTKTAVTKSLNDPQRNYCLSPLSEANVFSNSNVIDQHDCRLWNFIRENYLIEPSNKPYNLVHPNKDPSDKEGQNKIVLEILNNMKDGFFVECGAWDGEQLSATLRLERDFGWKGFLVEPHGGSFSKLRLKNRKARIANVCLAPTTHPQMMNYIELFEDVSFWNPALSSLEKHKREKGGNIVPKPCFPTFSLLSALNVTTVDFFLLDIEGAELDVLKTIPFEEILIKVFSIEWNHIPEGKEELLRFMLSKGYKLAKDLRSNTASDFILVHASIPLPEKFQNAKMTPVVPE